MADTRVLSAKPTDILKKDHDRVRELFERYEELETDDEETRMEIFNEIRQELVLHAEIEEDLFYPAVKEEGSAEATDLVAEAYEEHRQVRQLLDELSELDADDPEFDARMKLLRENVEHHADEEEREIFPKAKKLPKARQAELASEIEFRKRNLY